MTHIKMMDQQQRRMNKNRNRNREMLLMMSMMLHVMMMMVIFTAVVVVVTAQSFDNMQAKNKNQPLTIAVIGGGISGTFLTKYLVDYDRNCTIFHNITIFEPYPVHSTISSSSSSSSATNNATKQQQQQHQSSRIASYEMEIPTIGDPTTTTTTTTNINTNTTNTTTIVIELGASILHSGFYYVMEMIRSSNDSQGGGQVVLQLGPPYTTGNDMVDGQISDPTSMGIYNGQGKWSLLLTKTTIPIAWRKYYLLYRYSWDLVTVSRLSQYAQAQFQQLPFLLHPENSHPDSFFDTPNDIWDRLLLYTNQYITVTFDTFLDTAGVSSYASLSSLTNSTITKMIQSIYRTIRNFITTYIWNIMIPYQGSLRTELLTAMNLVNYNQNTTAINGITGLGSFAAATGNIYSLKGGNYQIIQSAFRQAVQNRNQYCAISNNNNNNPSASSSSSSVQMITKRIETVVGDLDGLALFAEGNEYVGEYDIVVLAVPLQQSQITFLIQSPVDPSIVQDMPLGGRINAHHKIVVESDGTTTTHDGHVQLPHPVPDSARRPYVQVVTTIVRDAVVNHTYFNVDNASSLPRSILMAANGKDTTYNITAITFITKGIYKVFSNNPLDPSVIRLLFGITASIEYEQIWGGPFGGATPDYQAYSNYNNNTTNFLLYDGANGLRGHTNSGALYYLNTMEQSAMSCMEISAIGAKAVAKLIAERVGLLQERPDTMGPDGHDEL